ncbi:hypothetical protein GCM10017786_60530 [Amycolatopsis deserti]|uniref:Uncharacterized protein n=1 Tax=Amycolatopsis deserti TaxID=185696 RepID=A0ABQ3JD04_9PSEU|nr:SDR family oxidoreductase [Amycolatopsis deserti]GHF18667.1 hypothetical protein GCM10017786_60530 [Amycolatopsis deserti]
MHTAILIGDSAAIAATRDRLTSAGWDFDGAEVDAVVFDPGLFDGKVTGNPAEDLRRLARELLPRLRSAADGGAAIVAIGSRDQLGWADRPAIAAAAGALAAMVRSLALELASRGVTVNLVAGGTTEPGPLLPTTVTPADIAETVAFFADPRSRYITGQVLFCCGGSSLLSSLSV